MNNSFSYERFRPLTRFKTEAQENINSSINKIFKMKNAGTTNCKTQEDKNGVISNIFVK